MSTYKAFAQAAAVNIDWEMVRRNHLIWLETQVVTLSEQYKAARAAGDPEAAALREQGVAMKRRLELAVAREAR